MRIAALYAGQIRTFDRVKNNHSINLIGNVDSYFYTNEEPNTNYKQFVKCHNTDYYQFPMDDYASNKNPITQLHGSLNQWRGMWTGFQLVPEDYDCYVKMRCDIEISAPIDFSQYEMKDHTVYIPSGNDHCQGCNDQLAFGNYSTMKKYFSIFTEHHKLFAKGLTFHTEFYVTENLKAQGVEIVRIPQTTVIIREGAPLVYSEDSRRITSEEPSSHWRMLNVKDKKVLDLGCGRMWELPTTPEFFLKKEASEVIGFEMWRPEKTYYNENVKDERLTVITHEIKTSHELKAIIVLFKPQCIKMDIEGQEMLMKGFSKEEFDSVEEIAIEYHSAEIKLMIESSFIKWGFNTIDHYIFDSFPKEEQGVIHLKK